MEKIMVDLVQQALNQVGGLYRKIHYPAKSGEL